MPSLKTKQFIRAIGLTALSLSTFVLVSTIDVYIRKSFNLTPLQHHYKTIGFSFLVISLNLLIAKKWFSFKEIGLIRRGFKKSLIYSLLFVGGFTLINFLGNRLELAKIDYERLVFLFTFVFLAFQEELMFRGVIFKVWSKTYGFIVALFISSILFGIEHSVYPMLGGTPKFSQEFGPGLFGIAFAVIMFLTNNLWGLAITHFLYNANLVFSRLYYDETIAIDNTGYLALGYLIFFPILIGYLYNRTSKVKKQIDWNKYLAWAFILLFWGLSIPMIVVGFAK